MLRNFSCLVLRLLCAVQDAQCNTRGITLSSEQRVNTRLRQPRTRNLSFVIFHHERKITVLNFFFVSDLPAHMSRPPKIPIEHMDNEVTFCQRIEVAARCMFVVKM